MKIVEQIGTIDSEFLALWRNNCAKVRALEMNPDVFSQQESIDVFMERWRFEQRLHDEFGLDDTRDWICSPIAGLVYYHGD